MREVLAHNPDLKAIAATARAFHYSAKSQHGEILPKLALSITGDRSKNNLSPQPANSFTINTGVSWQLDLWGKLAVSHKASELLAHKAILDLEQARQTLLGQTAKTWVDYWWLMDAEYNYNRLCEGYRRLGDHYEDSYKVGLASYWFFLDAKKTRENCHARLVEIKFQRRIQLELMNILRGQHPHSTLNISMQHMPLDFVTLPHDLPATLLSSRPDLQSAFAQMRAFSFEAHTAHKALLPQLTLNASAFQHGQNIKDAMDGNLLWQLVGGITQPLFYGNQLRSFAKQKSAEAEASWWQYRNQVLNALLEVSVAFAGDRMLRELMQVRQHAHREAQQKLRSWKRRFQFGDIPFADYLEADIDRIETKFQLRETQARYVKNRIVLVQTLGLPLTALTEAGNE